MRDRETTRMGSNDNLPSGAGITAPMRGQYRIAMFFAAIATVWLVYVLVYGWYSGLPLTFGWPGTVLQIAILSVMAWCWLCLAATGFYPKLVRTLISRITSRSRPTR